MTNEVRNYIDNQEKDLKETFNKLQESGRLKQIIEEIQAEDRRLDVKGIAKRLNQMIREEQQMLEKCCYE